MADLIAYTDMQTYLAIGTGQTVTFTAGEQTVATLICGAVSDAIRSAANRTFEIQGAATDRYFTYKYASGSYNSPLYSGWPGSFPFSVFPFPAFNLTSPEPWLEVDDFFLTGQTLAQVVTTATLNGTAFVARTAWPFNAAAKGNPYTKLVFAAGTTLPALEGGLKVNAKWGYVTSIPAGVKEMALIQAARWFKRPAAPFGIAGNDAMGTSMRLFAKLDPDVEAMAGNYRRWWAAA